MNELRVISSDANSVTYANPADPNYTVRFKTNSSMKNVDGSRLQNFITEIIVNDTNAVAVGSSSVSDALSLRIRFSGSDLSKARLMAIANSVFAQCTSEWFAQHILIGFRPDTSPNAVT